MQKPQQKLLRLHKKSASIELPCKFYNPTTTLRSLITRLRDKNNSQYLYRQVP